jgi:hypothetical protein
MQILLPLPQQCSIAVAAGKKSQAPAPRNPLHVSSVQWCEGERPTRLSGRLSAFSSKKKNLFFLFSKFRVVFCGA